MTDEKDENGELLPDEVRLTKFGKFLRSTSIDELPELFNILKGDAIKLVMPCGSWVTLIASAFVFAIVSAVANLFVIMDKETRNLALNFVKTKFLKKG